MENIKSILNDKRSHYLIGAIISFIAVSAFTGLLIQSFFITLLTLWLFSSPEIVKDVKNHKIYNYIIKYVPAILFCTAYLVFVKPDIFSFIFSFLISLFILFEFMGSNSIASSVLTVFNPLLLITGSKIIFKSINVQTMSLDNDILISVLPQINLNFGIIALLLYAINGIITLFTKHKGASANASGLIIFITGIFNTIFFNIKGNHLWQSSIDDILNVFKDLDIVQYTQNNLKWLLISLVIVVIYFIVTNLIYFKSVYYMKKHRIIKGVFSSIILLVLFVLNANQEFDINLI